MRDDTREGRPQHLAAQPMSTVSRTRPTAFQGRGKHLPARLRRHRGSHLTRRTFTAFLAGKRDADREPASLFYLASRIAGF
jgi:hypothetical protein